MTVAVKRLSNQSWFQIKSDNKVIHIDPAYVRGAIRGKVEAEKADLILLTHAHRDHCDPQALRDFCGSNTIIFGPPSCAKKAPGQFRAVAMGDESDPGWARIKAKAAYNQGAIRRYLHRKGACVGYLISIGGQAIYHAGDTDFIPAMASLGPVDLALLPISGLVTMDAEGAVEAAKAVKPRIVVPMHQNRADPAAFRDKLASAAPEIKIMLMKAGEEITL